ncbi:hypothetical protein V6N13_062487 [Hibiscus sabdariffa]|uniref:RIN4 pathogenic type III effector avirulence factor Avr cleavage site domain-containing protein n=2 Tax=Hibiscus sabdariffa TaxID=183260 RepID=A0ABR2ANA5_9ROSI
MPKTAMDSMPTMYQGYIQQSERQKYWTVSPTKVFSQPSSSSMDKHEGAAASIPKFGEWDETDPTSAQRFTAIFDKVKEEKNAPLMLNIPKPAHSSTTKRPFPSFYSKSAHQSMEHRMKDTKSTKISCFNAFSLSDHQPE